MDVTSALGIVVVWTLANLAVDGLILYYWRRRRARLASFDRQIDGMVADGDESASTSQPGRRVVPAAPRPLGKGFFLSVVTGVLVWGVLILLPGAMMAEEFTSNLTVRDAQVISSDQGSVVWLHLHLDSAFPVGWPVVVMLDGADTKNGFSALADFSNNTDQFVRITVPGRVSIGKHTLSYSYATHNTAGGDYWILAGGKSVDFQLTAEQGATGGTTYTAPTPADYGRLPGYAALVLLTYFVFRLVRGRRIGNPQAADDSVLLPEPPPGLTPSMAVVLRTGKVGTEAFTAALADLAARGYLSTSESLAVIQTPHKDPAASDSERPLGEAETELVAGWRRESGGALQGDDGRRLYERFCSTLGQTAASSPWFRSRPGQSIDYWTVLGIAMAFGGLGIFELTGQQGYSIGLLLRDSFDLIGVVGIVIAVCSYLWDTNRSADGARLLGMALAYRNALSYELIRAATADQGLESIQRRLSWLNTPEETVAWIVALDLKSEALELLDRTYVPSDDQARLSPGVAALKQLRWFPSAASSIARPYKDRA